MAELKDCAVFLKLWMRNVNESKIFKTKEIVQPRDCFNFSSFKFQVLINKDELYKLRAWNSGEV